MFPVEFKFSPKEEYIAVHCKHPRHGNYCRANRQVNENPSKPAQGRPAGEMIVWALAAEECVDAAAHKDMLSKTNLLVDERFSHLNRTKVRMETFAEFPNLEEFFRKFERPKRPLEPDEPP